MIPYRQDPCISVYSGRIRERGYGEAMDILFLGDAVEPLADLIAESRLFYGPYATVRYFITSSPKTAEQLDEDLVKRLAGDVEAEYSDHYSEYTGYLWTDEEINVGGHDLLAELRGYLGQYAHIEITWTKEAGRTHRTTGADQ